MKKLLFITIFFVSGFGVSAQTDSSGWADTATLLIAEKLPEYPGGEEARQKFIKKKLKYPKEARKNGIEGKVLVSFVVEKDGSLSNFTIIKDIGYGCGEEVVRVLKKMPKWKPGMQKGKTVRVRVSMPVIFKMPRED